MMEDLNSFLALIIQLESTQLKNNGNKLNNYAKKNNLLYFLIWLIKV